MPRPLFTPEKTRYPLYRRLGGPRAGLDRCGKSRTQRDSIPRPSSPYLVPIPNTLPGPQGISVPTAKINVGVLPRLVP
jgi:hypothetical protein